MLYIFFSVDRDNGFARKREEAGWGRGAVGL